MKYEITEITLPQEQGVEMASAYVNTSSARNQWVWIVDYPICAQKLQLAVYGETNIVRESDRHSALDFTNAKKPSSSGGSSSSSGSNNTKPTSPSSGYSEPLSSSSTEPTSGQENPSQDVSNPFENLIPDISSGLENLIPTRPTENDPTNTPEQPEEPTGDDSGSAE